MDVTQLETIERGVNAGYQGVLKPDDPPKFICTLEVQNIAGDVVWVQVFAGTVNMQYPFIDDPIQHLYGCGLAAPPHLTLEAWEPGVSATFVLNGVPAREQAAFVDQLFTKVLGCQDGLYKPVLTIEEVED